MGLHVIVTGNGRSQEKFVNMGVDQYIDYKEEMYWEVLSGVDYVIDTLGAAEFEHELYVLKRGGRLLSLKTGPNKLVEKRHIVPDIDSRVFSLAQVNEALTLVAKEKLNGKVIIRM